MSFYLPAVVQLLSAGGRWWRDPSSGTARVPGAQPSAAEVDVTPANLDRLADPQAGLEEPAGYQL